MNTSVIEINKSLMTIKSEEDLPPHISFEQYKILRNHHDIKNRSDRMLITLLWETGGRISDVLSFKWKNFEGLNSSEPNLRFVIQKTGKSINIPLSGEMATELREWKKDVIPKSDDNEYLFKGRSGKLGRETRQSIQKKMKLWGKLIGLPILHAHMFRHGLIVYLFLVQGLHYKVVASRTGHSNPMMILNTYSVVTNAMQRKMLENIPMR